MPNWCSVNITFEHNDPEMLARVVKAAEANTGILKEFIPVPEILQNEVASEEECLASCGYSNWYDFCTNEWGTKWDLSDPMVSVNDNGTVTVMCETAWGPPIAALDALQNQGFGIVAYYYEPGMQFAGIYTNDSHDEYSDWGDSNGATEMLPDELNDFFEITVSQRECEDEEKDDLLIFIENGIEHGSKTTD